MSHKDRLIQICTDLVPKEEIYNKRLKEELAEIEAQNEYDYFMDLYDRKVKFKRNENNLLIPYLLGLVENFNIQTEPEYYYGDFPDIDIDFLPIVRDYLKNEWAPKTFGKDYVVNICSYNTFGIKNALIDMARVFGKDRQEILNITTKIGLKDDDGDGLTLDSAIEMYPELKKYCEDNPDVVDAAAKMIGRKKSIGKHAGGLIISSVPVNNIVPLVVDKDDNPTSSWVEGLYSQDLGPVGFVKNDLLVITNLMQISIACKLIKERYGISSICASPGQCDWSDVSYLNDKKALELANNGDLRCIFQFDSDGIRNMVKKGGVDSFEDLVAYSSLYRPGPMLEKMHERYIERKRGREEYEIHELINPILGMTYGVMGYQEQVMKILNIVGDIPLKDCEIVRKAISKKKVEAFIKYKEMFVINGQKNLGWTKEQVEELWSQIEAFAGYGFNKCLSKDASIVDASSGNTFSIEEMFQKKNEKSFSVYSLNKEQRLVINKVQDIIFNGNVSVFELKTEAGRQIKATKNHQFLINEGWRKLEELKVGDFIATPKKNKKKSFNSDVYWDKIISIEYVGEEDVYDLTVEKDHNFIANDIIVHNSHAVAYTYVSSRLLWLKAHYPLEFFTAILQCETDSEKIKQYKIETERFGIKVCPLDINRSKENFSIVDNSIYIGFANIKGIGNKVALEVVKHQPYTDFDDFLNRANVSADVVKPLVGLNVFCQDPILLFKYYEHYKDVMNKRNSMKKRFESSTEIKTDRLNHILPEGFKNYYSKEISFNNESLIADIEEYNLNYSMPLEEVKDLFDRYKKSKELFESKWAIKIDTRSDFNPDDIELDEKLLPVLSDANASEEAFYGFLWIHPLEKSPDYTGYTFEKFRSEDLAHGYVEVRVLKTEKKISKNAKKTEYYLLSVEDAHSEKQYIQVWLNDWELFEDRITCKDGLIRIQVSPPSGGWNRYTLYSPQKHLRWKLPRKEYDYRVTVMRTKENK